LYRTARELTPTEAMYVFATDSAGALKALHAGQADKAIMPIHNVTGGLVHMTLAAMGEYTFKVEEWFQLSVQQCLMVKPGTDPQTITQVVSHDQGVRQCQQYLERTWPQLEQKSYPDTALAAQDLATGKLPATAAVIASRLAAQANGLVVLGESIQDHPDNQTTFIVVSL
jgi:prephenate dehydratase